MNISIKTISEIIKTHSRAFLPLPYPKLYLLFDALAEGFQHEVIDHNPQHADPDAQQLVVGERVAAEEQHKQDEQREHVGEHHGLVAGGTLQQQLHDLPHPVFLVPRVLHGDDLLPAVGGDADALGVAAAACGAHDDFHADVVAIDGADDAFTADVAFFVVHICSFFLASPPRTALRLYGATKLLPLRGCSRNYIS